MKKSLKLLVLPAAMVLCAGNLTSCTSTEKLVAMISDVGDIDDGSFNQSCWEGVKGYCKENKITYDYYRPFGDSEFARKCAIKQAVAKGAKIIILPGFKFKDAAKYASTHKEYVDKGVKFVLIDEHAIPDGMDKTPDNLICITFDFVYSGWLAGYAVAKDYYIDDFETGNGKLHNQYGFGFVGGNQYPSVYPFGYGFIEGVLYATEEFVVTHNIADADKPTLNFKTSYAGAFMQDDLTCANVKGWLTNQQEPIQCVFPCGGKLYQSITEAVNYYNEHNLTGDKRNFKDQEAPREAARWVGVDGDQYKLLHSEDDKKSIYTSALKDLGHAVKVCIEKSRDENEWSMLRHEQGGDDKGCYKIGLNEEHIKLKTEDPYDYVGIPLDTKADNKTLRSFNHVTVDEIKEKKLMISFKDLFKIYDGSTEFAGKDAGDFKSLGTAEFKADKTYNLYTHDDLTVSKYQKYTVE